MSFALDHVMIATADGAGVERELSAFGLTFTRRSVHAGQGTANACASFEGSFLELAFPHDLGELRSGRVRPLGLDERIHWRETGACPFAVAFRPDDDGGSAPWPFETWTYTLPDFPPGFSLEIATPPGRRDEPLVFVVRRPPGGPRPQAGSSPPQRGARRTITRVAVARAPGAAPRSTALDWFVRQGLLDVTNGTGPLLDITWDGGAQGESHRFSEAVPLLLRW